MGGNETHHTAEIQRSPRARHAALRVGRPQRAGGPPTLAEVRPQGQPERHTGVGFELVLDPVVPQLGRELVEVPNVSGSREVR